MYYLKAHDNTSVNIFFFLPSRFSVFASLRSDISSSRGLIFWWSSIICAATKKQSKLLLVFRCILTILFFFFSPRSKLSRSLTQISNPRVTRVQHQRLFSYLISDVLQFTLQIFEKDRTDVLFPQNVSSGVNLKQLPPTFNFRQFCLILFVRLLLQSCYFILLSQDLKH